MPAQGGPTRANTATLSARPSDPRLREAQRLHHEERQFQRQADEAARLRGQAASESKDLTIAKASREAEIEQLNKAIGDSRQQLFEAHDRIKALELEALSLEKSNPGKAADIREQAAALQADIPELERFAGRHEAKLLEAWDDVKAMEVSLSTAKADVTRLSAETDRLRKLAEDRESAAEALERQRNAEPLRADVPEVDIYELDALRTALRNGHRVGVGTDGHIHVFEERGPKMTDEQMAYLESKLPELRHRIGEGWNFSIESNGEIGGNGPWQSHYFASPNGQLGERALAEVRDRVGHGYDVSIAPDGTVVTSEPAVAASASQARHNLDTFNREMTSGSMAERMASGQGYDLNSDGTSGYSAIAPMTPSPVTPVSHADGAMSAAELASASDHDAFGASRAQSGLDAGDLSRMAGLGAGGHQAQAGSDSGVGDDHEPMGHLAGTGAGIRSTGGEQTVVQSWATAGDQHVHDQSSGTSGDVGSQHESSDIGKVIVPPDPVPTHETAEDHGSHLSSGLGASADGSHNTHTLDPDELE